MTDLERRIRALEARSTFSLPLLRRILDAAREGAPFPHDEAGKPILPEQVMEWARRQEVAILAGIGGNLPPWAAAVALLGILSRGSS